MCGNTQLGILHYRMQLSVPRHFAYNNSTDLHENCIPAKGTPTATLEYLLPGSSGRSPNLIKDVTSNAVAINSSHGYILCSNISFSLQATKSQ